MTNLGHIPEQPLATMVILIIKLEVNNYRLKLEKTFAYNDKIKIRLYLLSESNYLYKIIRLFIFKCQKGEKNQAPFITT